MMFERPERDFSSLLSSALGRGLFAFCCTAVNFRQ
jgi:hypothetical protein